MPVVNYHQFKDRENPTSRAKLTEKFGDNWIYVGRRNDAYGFSHSALANPFVGDPRGKGILVDNPLESFRVHLWQKIKAKDRAVLEAMERIGPDTGIVCWCEPRPCHARIVENAAAWLRSQKANPPQIELPDMALSVMQPWAWLIIRPDITDPAERAAAYAQGWIKDIENRTWGTKIRGRILLHTGQRIDKDAYPFLTQRFPHVPVPPPERLETGGILGHVDITDCVTDSPSSWFFGEYGFVLADSRPLPFKKVSGKRGFFPCEY